MLDRQDLYCKIFVNGVPTREDLLQLVARTVGGTIEYHTVIAAGAEIYVAHNDDDDALRAREADGFVFYPHYLDVTAVPRTDAQRPDHFGGHAPRGLLGGETRRRCGVRF